MATTWYNDNDPYCAAWLRNLQVERLIAEGDVIERPIQDIRAADLADVGRAHFFAGIGGWDYALRLAGWPDDRPVWTGSCPCQPFSVAGKRRGTQDDRHLWPVWRGLIAECRPATIFGEQVASKDGRIWLAGVRADLEAMGYAVGAADLCAAGVGAPHIRQRLYWVADSTSGEARPEEVAVGVRRVDSFWEDYSTQTGRCCGRHNEDCRRTESEVSPVAYGSAENVARLSAIGNSLVPQVAATFVRAFMETEI